MKSVSLEALFAPGRVRRAFSLIELLIVIAIIGILAALLLPVLSRTKAKTQQIQCVDNLKQLQTGWHMYLGDHNDTMPPNLWDGVRFQAAGSAPGSWVVGNALETTATNIQRGVQWPYNPALGVYRCPVDTSLAKDGSTPRFRSYSLLNYLGGDLQAGELTASRTKQRGSQLAQTSRVMAFVCEDAISINDGIFFVYPSPASEWKDLPASRHSQGGAFSFADGHAEYWKWQSTPPSDTDDLPRIQSALPDP